MNTRIMMGSLTWTVSLLALLAALVGLLSTPLAAQDLGHPRVVVPRCKVEGGGVIRGTVTVRDDRGHPWGHGPVKRAERTPVILDGRPCGTATDGQGRYLFSNVPDGLHVVKVEGIGWWPGFADTVRVYGDTIALDLVVVLGAEVAHEFSGFMNRPPVLMDPEGVEGCYWIGGGPDRGKVVALRHGGSITVSDAESPGGGWRRSPDNRSISVDLARTMFWGRQVVIQIGDDADWSDLHLRYSWWSDMEVSHGEIETFGIRVACGDWGISELR